MTNAFDTSGPSIWTRDEELKRKLQGQEWAKKTQAKRNINDKTQVFQYSKAKCSKPSSS